MLFLIQFAFLCQLLCIEYSLSLTIYDDKVNYTDLYSLFRPVDPSHCRRNPILHDTRGKKDSVVQKYSSQLKSWNKEVFDPHLSEGTLVTDSIFVDLPKGGNFVFWSMWQGNGRAWSHPVFDMSAWQTDENNHIFAEIGSCTAGPFTWNFVHPHDRESTREIITLQGDYAIYISAWFEIYQHQLIDRLGYLIYLSKTLPSTTKFLLPTAANAQTITSMLNEIDPQLSTRIEVIKCDSHFDCHNQQIEVKNGSLKILAPKSSTRHLELYQLLRAWLWNSPIIQSALSKVTEKTVVYYKRSSDITGRGIATNARYMNQQQEDQIIQRIEHALRRYNRDERLVVFDGTLRFLDQIKLFHSATTIIGPHGGGLANILLTAPSHSCAERPKVLEFVTNTDTPQVQRGQFLEATYYTLYATCPWVELHQILFTKLSNRYETYIDMDAFDDALKSMFGLGSAYKTQI